MNHIGKTIKSIQKKRNISVIELAKKVNTSRNNIYNIYNRKSIDTVLLQKLCDILDYNFFNFYVTNDNTEFISKEDDEDSPYQKGKQITNLESRINKLEEELQSLKDRLHDKETIIELMRNENKKDV